MAETEGTVQTEDGGAWQARAEAAERELALRRAVAGVEWMDAEDAYRAMLPLARAAEGGGWEAELPATEGAAPRRVGLEEAARELAARKPHWVRARVVGGSGAGSGQGAAASSISYAELLKPENAGRLKHFLNERPADLERLRRAHFGRS